MIWDMYKYNLKPIVVRLHCIALHKNNNWNVSLNAIKIDFLQKLYTDSTKAKYNLI